MKFYMFCQKKMKKYVKLGCFRCLNCVFGRKKKIYPFRFRLAVHLYESGGDTGGVGGAGGVGGTGGEACGDCGVSDNILIHFRRLAVEIF